MPGDGARGRERPSCLRPPPDIQASLMTMHLALAAAALVASAVLFFSAARRALPAVALLASGIEVVGLLGWLHLRVAQVNLGLVLGLCLAIPGLIAWFRSGAKSEVSASAIVAFVGIVQSVVASHLIH